MAIFALCLGASEIGSRLGQMLLVGFHGSEPSDAWTKKIAVQLQDGTIGGVIFYGYNIESPEQFKRLVQFLAINSTNALFALDEEGGKVQRLAKEKGFGDYPSPATVSKKYSPKEAYDIYKTMAKELKEYGINYNLAPVVDININLDSPIIGGLGRSFGKNSLRVTRYAKEFIKAHDSEGVLTSLKHFPGHGSAKGDTHKGLTDVSEVWQEEELEPFANLIDAGLARSIMSAHVINRNIDSLPASLSQAHIGILRGHLGYDGVVISDDLQMGAIAKEHTLKETVIKAINAGNDMLIFSNYFDPSEETPQIVLSIIKEALASGEIERDRIKEAIARIEKMKERLRN